MLTPHREVIWQNGVVCVFFEKEYIQNGGNPCKIRISAVFLCPFVAYLSLKSANRY